MPTLLQDLNQYWGGDISTSNTGDMATASATLRGQQRVLRRLLTNPGDYVFHPDYGAGLPGFIGQPLDPGKVAAVIRSQLLLEDSVARSPAPVITVTPAPTDPTAIAVRIQYNDAATNVPTTLAFNVSK